jgi:hypothetical protein
LLAARRLLGSCSAASAAVSRNKELAVTKKIFVAPVLTSESTLTAVIALSAPR